MIALTLLAAMVLVGFLCALGLVVIFALDLFRSMFTGEQDARVERACMEHRRVNSRTTKCGPNVLASGPLTRRR
jgi:hypothetical protein